MAFLFAGTSATPIKLSSSYLLSDLTRTDYINLQDSPSPTELANLKKLAAKLEKLASRVGVFDVISGYRSDAIQQELRQTSNAAAMTRSLHQEGMAVDIVPRIMTVKGFWEKAIQNGFYKELGEFYLKPTHNSIHLSLPTPSKTAVAGIMDASGNYIRLTLAELAKLDPSSKTSQALSLAGFSSIGFLIVGSLASFYFLNTKRKPV